MVRPLFDTNVLVDYLNGVAQARSELDLYDAWGISVITWMEIMIGTDEHTEAATRRFLGNFDVYPIDDAVAELAVSIRRERRLKLPDAIIHATAGAHAMLLVTRNERDFPWAAPGIRMPYRLKP